jgi:4-hydroxyproline epimerase
VSLSIQYNLSKIIHCIVQKSCRLRDFDPKQTIMPDSFAVLDTHTGGEITRVLFAAEIGLRATSPTQQVLDLRDRLDWVRTTLTSEPRGSAFAVGAIVTPPAGTSDSWGIVFFNNVGYLGMCGHGLIGVVEALRHQGRITTGETNFVTPAGPVATTLGDDRSVTFTGVLSYPYRLDVSLTCADGSVVVGDIAYGGNWFFLVSDKSIHSSTIGQLMAQCQLIRDAIQRDNIRGCDGAVIDHIELCGPLHPEGAGVPISDERGCRSFVLCPGGHYDRSPCGTGTSAKLACLASRGELLPGQSWIQESVTGSRFVASYRADQDGVRVKITGNAHVIAETIQLFDSTDPLRFGLQESTL